MATLPVVAAIPNYNMASELRRLLPQVVAQNYDQVFILDDASTDDSREVVAEFGDCVTLVVGEKNICSSGNRNRIMGQLGHNAIIHFLDADTELLSEHSPETLQALFCAPNLGFIGGLVLDPEGKQSIWNYGPLASLQKTITAQVHHRAQDPSQGPVARISRRLGEPFVNDWPDPRSEPSRRKVDWVLEANMAITRDTFEALGGFDPNVRRHDIVDLSIKAYKQGLDSYFDPSFVVTQHNDSNVRPDSRAQARRRATRYLIRKHGLWFWLTNQ